MIKYPILVALTLACSVDCYVTSTCKQKETSNKYLDIAIDVIRKAKDSFPTCDTCEENAARKVMDCADLLLLGNKRSGVYKIWPVSRITGDQFLEVYCDMHTDGGGWTVIQRRGDFQRPKDYFYKDWKSYKEGFGDIQKDFWLGNDNIFALSNQKLYSVRFDLTDVEGNKRHALYDKFWIEDEINKYKLHISDYSGDAGNAMTPHHDNQKFSTKDQKNDNYSKDCAHLYKGGWWYNACHWANLNGLYHKGKHESYADGVNWGVWKGNKESLEGTEIKIRPKNFRRSYNSTM